MAEGRESLSGDIPADSFEENRQPLGYPLHICEDAPEPKYLCSHCKIVLKEAVQTACGHRYCSECLAWIVRSNKNPICESCQEEDPDAVTEESLLSIEKDHHSTCEFGLIPCHIGCGKVVMRKNLADHLRNDCANITSCFAQNQEDSQNTTYQPPSEVSPSDDRCQFSRIGCLFKGNREDREEHESCAVGPHLILLLHYVKELNSSLYPAGGRMNSGLTDTKVLMGLFYSLKLQGALEAGTLVGLHPCEEEGSQQILLPRRAKVVSLLESRLQVFENIASVLSKEMSASRQKILAFRSQRGLDQDMILGLELKVADLQRCLTQKSSALGKLKNRLYMSAQASYDGIFLWKITDVQLKCYEAVCGKAYSICSPAFYTSRYGYKLCMRIFLNGEGKSKGSHVSLFVVLLRGEHDALLSWPFTHKVTLMLIDQNDGEHHANTICPDPASTAFQRPVADMNDAIGFPSGVARGNRGIFFRSCNASRRLEAAIKEAQMEPWAMLLGVPLGAI